MDLSGHDQGEMLPIPITSAYVGAVHGHHHHLHDQQQPASINGPLPPPPPPPHPLSTEFNKGPEVKYKECLKNHAASLGGVATDGCGEFMPGGAEGTPEALKCSACTCHRNFHRKEVDGEPSTFHHHHPLLKLPPPSSTRLPPPPPHHHHHHMIMPLGALQASESDEMEGIASMARGPSAPAAAKKKRFRTKFTPEQKERMLQFAERAGWRLQGLEEGVVQQFCQEIGVKRRVLKVWMHNNKHNLAKKTSSSLQIE